MKNGGIIMRKFVKSFFGESVRTKRDPYSNAGFKAYENPCCNDARGCNCTKRSQQRKVRRAQGSGRDGLFK